MSTEPGDVPSYLAQLEKFMSVVAHSVQCLPSYASPDPEDGNSHIIKALNARQEAMQGLADALEPDTLDAIADEITTFTSSFLHSARADSLRVLARKARAALDAARKAGFIKGGT